MENYTGFVQQALDRLGPMRSQDERATEENKARLTRLAAYLIHQRNPNIGLIRKDTGNNVMGMSVDLILDRTNGEFADIASDTDDGGGFRRIIPMFIPNTDPTLVPRWVEPTATLAGVDDQPLANPNPNPTVNPNPTPNPPPDNMAARFDAMGTRFDAVGTRVDSVGTRVDAMGGRFDSIDARLAALEASLKTQADQLNHIVNDLNRAAGVMQNMGSLFKR
jgi:hypothetical protein